MTSSPVLPPELMDRIVDHLHYDTSALRNCALVCHAWLPGARFHLFQALLIDSSKLDRFETLICTAPHILAFIQKLRICELSQGQPSSSHLPSLISSIPRLRTLDLYWASPHVPNSALLATFACITQLNMALLPFIYDCASLGVFLVNFPRLEALSIYGLSPTANPERATHGTDTLLAVLSKLPLRRLVVGTWHETILSIIPRVSLATLTSLTWIGTFNTEHAPRAMLDTRSSSLQEVTLDFSRWVARGTAEINYLPFIDLCPPGLRTLRIRGLLRKLTLSVRALGPLLRLRFADTHIHLICNQNFASTEKEIVANLQHLAQALTNDSMRTVHVVVCFAGDIMDERQLGPGAETVISPVFSQLVSRGSVRLKYVSNVWEAKDQDLIA